MNIRPIKNQVIVRPDPPVAKIGLIYVPEAVTGDNPNYFPESGVVVALGRTSYTEDGEAEQPFAVAVGDRVHFNRYAGKQVTCTDDGVLYLVMREPEIVAIVEGAHEILHGYEAPADDGVRAYTHDPFAGL